MFDEPSSYLDGAAPPAGEVIRSLLGKMYDEDGVEIESEESEDADSKLVVVEHDLAILTTFGFCVLSIRTLGTWRVYTSLQRARGNQCLPGWIHPD